jgi:hypothetical protein
VTAAVRDRRLQALALAFARHGITADRRTDRLRLCSDHAGRRIRSSTDLTPAEVDTLIARLDRLPVGSLPGAIARLVAAEERRARELATRSRPPVTPGAARCWDDEPGCDCGGRHPDPMDVAVGVLTRAGLLAPATQLSLEAPDA